MDPEKLIAHGQLCTARKAIYEMVSRNFDQLWKLYHKLVEEGQELLAGFIAYCSGSRRMVDLLDSIGFEARTKARRVFVLVGNGDLREARMLLTA